MKWWGEGKIEYKEKAGPRFVKDMICLSRFFFFF